MDNTSSNGALDALLSFICEVPQKEEVQDIKSTSSGLLGSEDKLLGSKESKRYAKSTFLIQIEFIIYKFDTKVYFWF